MEDKGPKISKLTKCIKKAPMCINMSVNSSSFADPTILPPNVSSNSSVYSCFSSGMTIFIFSTYSITSILSLPVLIFVLYLGYQEWRKQRSASTAKSHSDVFTHHSIVMQLAEFLGFTSYICGNYIKCSVMMTVASNVLAFTTIGQALFQVLNCVEHYLAVVHPIVYMRLRQTGGVRIRNITTGCVWLLCCGILTVSYVANAEVTQIFFFCIKVFFLAVISFCSIWVLCALKRPGPGEAGGNRERVDKTKQRAFHTIIAIMVVLLFKFGGNLMANMIWNTTGWSPNGTCVLVMSIFWFDLPSSLVLPLLFLHREGKLPCYK